MSQIQAGLAAFSVADHIARDTSVVCRSYDHTTEEGAYLEAAHAIDADTTAKKLVGKRLQIISWSCRWTKRNRTVVDDSGEEHKEQYECPLTAIQLLDGSCIAVTGASACDTLARHAAVHLMHGELTPQRPLILTLELRQSKTSAVNSYFAFRRPLPNE